jgi:hypothetical protein
VSIIALDGAARSIWGYSDLCIERPLNASEYGIGDEGDSVYGEKADFRSGLGI